MTDKTLFVLALHNVCATWEQVEKQLSQQTANPQVNESLALMRDQYKICRTHLEFVLQMYDHAVDNPPTE